MVLDKHQHPKVLRMQTNPTVEKYISNLLMTQYPSGVAGSKSKPLCQASDACLLGDVSSPVDGRLVDYQNSFRCTLLPCNDILFFLQSELRLNIGEICHVIFSNFNSNLTLTLAPTQAMAQTLTQPTGSTLAQYLSPIPYFQLAYQP